VFFADPATFLARCACVPHIRIHPSTQGALQVGKAAKPIAQPLADASLVIGVCSGWASTRSRRLWRADALLLGGRRNYPCLASPPRS
jgi:hypothetical protein